MLQPSVLTQVAYLPTQIYCGITLCMELYCILSHCTASFVNASHHIRVYCFEDSDHYLLITLPCFLSFMLGPPHSLIFLPLLPLPNHPLSPFPLRSHHFSLTQLHTHTHSPPIHFSHTHTGEWKRESYPIYLSKIVTTFQYCKEK